MPYVCIQGDAISGCNGKATYWTETDHSCQKCCGLSQFDLSIEGDGRIEQISTCEKDCGENVCRDQQCSREEPYACIEGGIDSDATIPTYGCNGNPTYRLEKELNCATPSTALQRVRLMVAGSTQHATRSAVLKCVSSTVVRTIISSRAPKAALKAMPLRSRMGATKRRTTGSKPTSFARPVATSENVRLVRLNSQSQCQRRVQLRLRL